MQEKLQNLKDKFLKFIEAHFGIILIIGLILIYLVQSYITPEYCDVCKEDKAIQNCPTCKAFICDSCDDDYEYRTMRDYLKKEGYILLEDPSALYDIYAYGYFNGHLGVDGLEENETEYIINGYDYDKLKEYFDSYWEQK